jgi:hypothetical protein
MLKSVCQVRDNRHVIIKIVGGGGGRNEIPLVCTEDSRERFARLTRHLKTGQGQPLESMLFKLEAERRARGE